MEAADGGAAGTTTSPDSLVVPKVGGLVLLRGHPNQLLLQLICGKSLVCSAMMVSLADGVIANTRGAAVISLSGGCGLRMAKFFQASLELCGFAAIEEEGSKFSF